MKLENKVALITGAGGLQGRAAAVLFASEGAKLVVVDIMRDTGKETVKIIKESKGEAIFVEADVSKLADAKKMVHTTINHFGRLDILYNNAGIMRGRQKVIDLPEDEWDRVLDVNLKSIFLVSKYAIPYMIEKGGGVIINTSSISGLYGFAAFPAYCASKAGVILITKAMAIDHAEDNIRVNCICPGTVGYPDSPPRHGLHELTPMNRKATADEIAKVALFLASTESSYMTGANIIVDGGMTAGFAPDKLKALLKLEK